MKSIRNIFKIGVGPSSSHTMAPAKAAQLFKSKLLTDNSTIAVELLGSLAHTGKGHLTDKALIEALSPRKVKVLFNKTLRPKTHSNTLIFKEIADNGATLQQWEVYSVGGGMLADKSGKIGGSIKDVYEFGDYDGLKAACIKEGKDIQAIIASREDEQLWQHLAEVWLVMKNCIQRGLNSKKTTLPGKLNLKRKARHFSNFAGKTVGLQRDIALISSYALACSEENASGNKIVTAPTCGSCGVLPAILYYYHNNLQKDDDTILKALAVAGLIGLFVENNASISGAEVGCQGEIGTACAMASAAATFIQGGNIAKIEYSAEIAIEHFLGLTCDPVMGLVQIPCIERNAFAAMRALECSIYSLSTDLEHKISFDEVVKVMYKTGIDMHEGYKETAKDGLANLCRLK